MRLGRGMLGGLRLARVVRVPEVDDLDRLPARENHSLDVVGLFSVTIHLCVLCSRYRQAVAELEEQISLFPACLAGAGRVTRERRTRGRPRSATPWPPSGPDIGSPARG